MKTLLRRGLALLGVVSVVAGAVGCAVVGGTGGDSAPGEATIGEPANGDGGAPGPGSGEVALARVPPVLDTQERIGLGYPQEAPIDWPEMLYLGEEGQIGEVGVRPVEIRVVEGSSVAMVYSPEAGEMVPAPEGSVMWMRQAWNRPALLIPPNASVVMVRVEMTPSVGVWSAGVRFAPATYSCPVLGQSDYGYDSRDFRVAYPDLGEAQILLTYDEWWFGEYQSVSYECPGSGWLYFYVPGTALEPSLLWLEYTTGSGQGRMAIWTLTERP